MSRKEQEFLNSRIEKSNEIIIAHYIKRCGAYIFNAFFGYDNLKIIVFELLAIGLAALTTNVFKADLFGEDKMVSIIFCLIVGIPALCYVIFAFKKLLHYKYLKHVIVSSLGIYIAVYCYGKARPQWSLYEWRELKQVSLKRQSLASHYKLGDAVEKAISKLTRTQSFYMDRWDGEEKVNLLNKEAVQEILICFKEAKKSARRTKKKKEQ